MPTILEPDNIFIHDGAPIYRSGLIRDVLQELGVRTMLWPPYSPDLNPTENLWAILKAEVYKLYPELEFADDTEKTLLALIEAAKEAWHTIEDTVLYNLSVTMSHRVQAVIEADGWYTKY